MRALMGLLVVCLPLKNLSVTSGFGYCVHPVTGEYAFHEGVDLRARHDTVFAIMDGLVTAAEYQSVIGLHLCIEHGQIQSVYGHLSRLFVAEKDLVFAGQPIGITGATGRVTGEHLHFAIRCGQRFIDPLQFLYELLIKKEHEQEF